MVVVSLRCLNSKITVPENIKSARLPVPERGIGAG